MRLVLGAGDGLNAASCDRLLARLAGAKAASHEEVTIDLQAAAFIDPYGAACLCLAARHLAEQRQQRLILVLPSSRRAQLTVAQTGLAAVLRPWAEAAQRARP